jgi:hypothetical protein
VHRFHSRRRWLCPVVADRGYTRVAFHEHAWGRRVRPTLSTRWSQRQWGAHTGSTQTSAESTGSAVVVGMENGSARCEKTNQTFMGSSASPDWIRR